MANRLAGSVSPYLLQHQNNPVDWYPWGPEAFAKAKAENKPIFLSVGYSSCHWCHVMEHECFEDAEVAERLNADFVSIKVDREERPDVDEAYMAAVQIQTGRGGWPMSVFMTPDRQPFLCGTYFPKHDRGQAPGFLSLLKSVRDLWSTREQDVIEAASEMERQLQVAFSREAPQPSGQLDMNAIARAVEAAEADFDRELGGFGQAPKFPPHTAIELFLWLVESPSVGQETRQKAAQMAFLTLEAMALGGLQDHVGGGFHRYSTDRYWLLPHFEKMLYDNALMLGNYVRGARIARMIESPVLTTFAHAAHGIVRWLEGEMLAPEGLFYSALDADSEGEEGKYYVWSVDEVRAFLGDRADRFIEAFQFDPQGNFADEATGQRTGFNIPFRTATTDDAFGEELDALRSEREKRVRPGLDDKALVGWNGLAIHSLAEAGRSDLAEGAAKAILSYEAKLGELPHQIAKGVASGPGFLEDYAGFGLGLLRLAMVLQSQEYAGHAGRIAQEMARRFYDAEQGGLFSTGEGHEELFGRTKPVFDQPIPSANAMAIRLLLGVGMVEEAMRSLQAAFGWMEKVPQATEGLYLAAGEFLEAMQIAAAVAESEGEMVAPAPSPSSLRSDEEGEIGSPPSDPLLIPTGRDKEGEGKAIPSQPGKVAVTMPNRELEPGPDGWARTEVHISIPQGWHINSSDPPMRWLIPTQITVQPLESEAEYPASAEIGYEGNIVIPVRIKAAGKNAEFELKVVYQACTESECLEPAEVRFDGVVR